ncbi:hypothetical protein [Halomontanus rarus]|uniref:hypothetical protein n=1 Tax=Halomontanus rarus TaxID=3034020 RepID=UPI00293B8E18|nr:hypothetical protein [Halovivax sp. KZCA124]
MPYSSPEEAFWDILCSAAPLLKLVFVMNSILVGLLLVSVPFLTAGSESFYVAIFGASFIALTFLCSGLVLFVCKQRVN